MAAASRATLLSSRGSAVFRSARLWAPLYAPPRRLRIQDASTFPLVVNRHGHGVLMASVASPGVASGGGSPQRAGVPLVVLKRGKSRLFRDGQPIVFSGAVDRVVGRPAPVAGDCVLVGDGSEAVIGWGVFNPDSMFRVRIMQLAWEADKQGDSLLNLGELVRARLAAAAALRAAAGLPGRDTNVYRLCNSEGDRLSGLVVDVLGPVAVVASSAVWVERYRDAITACLTALPGITTVVWRPNEAMLREEGMLEEQINGGGEAVEEVQVMENGVKFIAAPGGQKTGFYADQRDNRTVVARMCSGKRVLDLCSYSGAFGIRAAMQGATAVTCVDSSESALDLGRRNAELNGVAVEFVKADVKAYMQEAAATGAQWDVVILDPPKLAPNRKSLNKAVNKYKSLNSAAMRITAEGGFLLTCTCSGAMTQAGDFPSVIHSAALAARKNARSRNSPCLCKTN